MKIGLIVHKIHQFEPDTGKNTQYRCVAKTAKIEGLISPLNASSMAKMKLTEFLYYYQILKMFAQSNQTEWTESQSFRGLQGYRLPSIDTVMAGCPLSIILGKP